MIIRLTHGINFQCHFDKNLSSNCNDIYAFDDNFSRFYNRGLNSLCIYFNLYKDNPHYINNPSSLNFEMNNMSRYLLHSKFIKIKYNAFVFKEFSIKFDYGDVLGAKREHYLALKEYKEKWKDDFPIHLLYLKDKFIAEKKIKSEDGIYFAGIVRLEDLKYYDALMHFCPFYLPSSLNYEELKHISNSMLNSDDWAEIETMILNCNGIWQSYFYQEDYGFLLVGKDLTPLYEEIQEDFKYLNMENE